MTPWDYYVRQIRKLAEKHSYKYYIHTGMYLNSGRYSKSYTKLETPLFLYFEVPGTRYA